MVMMRRLSLLVGLIAFPVAGIAQSRPAQPLRPVHTFSIVARDPATGQLGVAVPIDEKLMDAATVLGACGIAYALRYIRANIQGGIEIGFDVRTANLIAAQTVKGAAELLIRSSRHPEEEIDKVTTPKGCTIAGLNEMEHQGFSSSLIKGITVSYQKILKG